MVHRLHIVSQHNAHGTMLLGAGELPGMHVMVECQYLGIRALVCHFLPGKPIETHSKKDMCSRPDNLQNAYQLDTTN